MSDPSDRFAETMTCGCEWHAGTLFPCAQHRAQTTPTTASPTGRLLEAAWGIIANAGGGDWTRETPEWQAAAARWRDDYHRVLHGPMTPEQEEAMVTALQDAMTVEPGGVYPALVGPTLRPNRALCRAALRAALAAGPHG